MVVCITKVKWIFISPSISHNQKRGNQSRISTGSIINHLQFVSTCPCWLCVKFPHNSTRKYHSDSFLGFVWPFVFWFIYFLYDFGCSIFLYPGKSLHFLVCGKLYESILKTDFLILQLGFGTFCYLEEDVPAFL